MTVDGDAGPVLERESNPNIYRFPFAAAPDIIRSNQKDAYFQAVLFDHLSTILRNVRGARFVHNYATEARAAADAIYLSLTTLLGNRTLGEEYCDIVQVEATTERLPALTSRAGYIIATVLVPYAAGRLLPQLRKVVRTSLEGDAHDKPRPADTSTLAAVKSYILENLDTITSPAPIYALSLATFYFSGAYYHLSKRLFNLRYIFTHTSPSNEHRAGYEVLGVLLVLQISVQAYLHLHSTLASAPSRTGALPQLVAAESLAGTSAVLAGGAEVSLDPNAYSSNNALLFSTSASDADLSSAQRRLAATTHTDFLTEPRFDLQEKELMRWLSGRQARKCTLCLEPMKDPSATTCGHLFCWVCICDWCREKPECPLCRQTCLVQHVLPLRE